MKNIKSKLLLIAFIVLVTSFINLKYLQTNIANAEFDFWSMFDTEEKGISFTNYEGQLTQLSPEGYDTALTQSTDLKDFIIKIINYALGFLGFAAVIIVIYGGVLYVTSAGDTGKTETAKKAITYAAIGILIILGSYAFVNAIIGAGGGGSQNVGTTSIGANTGGNYNSTSENVRSIAVDVYTGFSYLSGATEDINNIRNETNKASLAIENKPTKGEILSHLSGIAAKLNNLNARGKSFSTGYIKINNYLRDLDSVIDRIENAKSNDEIYNIWLEYKPKITSNGDGSLGDVLKAISDSYELNLEENFNQLYAIWVEVKNIEAIGTTGNLAYESFQNLKKAYGIQENEQQETISFSEAGTNNLIAIIKSWELTDTTNPIDTANTFIVTGLQAQSDFYKALKSIQFVQARLAADVLTGNAPLTVNFDALATSDPAGGSLKSENILWDLAGTKSLKDLQSEKDYSLNLELLNPGDTMSCELTGSSDTETKDTLIGSTSQRCTFLKPGNYLAAIKIKSNEPTKYAPGISILTIKVKPPNTKIELKVETTEKNYTVMHYEADELITDRKTVSVTLNEAKNGIKFDASGTNADSYKWSFGNGDFTDQSTNDIVEDYRGYTQSGKYQVMLEVKNKVGVVDRKIFTLEISNIVARIEPSVRSRALINTPIIFDGRLSKSDLGRIREYQWVVSIPETGQVVPPEAKIGYPFERSGSQISTLTFEFKYPLLYDISLTVTDSNGESSTDVIKNYRVESKKPVAAYTVTNTDASQPGTFKFNADGSFDPDGSKDFLKYEWTINAAPASYKFINGTSKDSKIAEIKFNKKDTYEVTLKVTDSVTTPPREEYGEITKKVVVDKVLDIAWSEDQKVTEVLNDQGKAEVDFVFSSDNAIAYEMDFGDGSTQSGSITGTATVPHTYTNGGKYIVKLTVYDSEDDDNSIQKRILIGGSGKPIAKITLYVNGVRFNDLADPIAVSKKDTIKFDAGESLNTDGTGRKLLYSWNFGDLGKSANKETLHTYKELSPKEPGYYIATLKVSDKDDASINDEDSVKISVQNMPPKFTSIQGIAKSNRGDLTTPVQVTMKVYGAEDPDGAITQYKWWYFDTKNPDEPMGMQITTAPTAILTIGTNGKEGDSITYGLGLEITDNDNLKFSSYDVYTEGDVPTVTVKNGPNKLPTAKFSVSATKVFKGQSITFTSSSTDPDGQIVKYLWDFEGDGFFNNEPTREATVEHIYETKNLTGIPVRLKVMDDMGGEALSEAVNIFVDIDSKPPVANFIYEEVDGFSGKKIKFTNTSTADEEADARIVSFEWDFDTSSSFVTSDSNNNNVKDDDIDSREENPERLYNQYYTYKVKLRVKDDQNKVGEIVKEVPIINNTVITSTGTTGTTGSTGQISGTEVQQSSLKAKLTTNPLPGMDGIIYLPGTTGAVTFDFSKSEGLINTFAIDKNIYYDTNGNGIKQDDEDFKTTLPGSWRTNFDSAWGDTVVKLTVKDIYGNENSVLQEIKFK